MPKKLNESQIQAALPDIPKWALEQGELVRNTAFVDFKQAMTFVNTVAELAELAGHHPDIDIRYNKVRLVLVTHDAAQAARMGQQTLHIVGGKAVAV